ncbi:hypothetical protein D3C72_2352600 [compost metagenome]
MHEKLDVGPFMIMETLAWCHAHGVSEFDFLPSGPLAGVKAYKASYGAQEAPFLSASCQSVRGRCLSLVWRQLSAGAQVPPAPATAP